MVMHMVVTLPEITLHKRKTQEQIDALKAVKIDIGFGRVHIEDPDVEQEFLFDEPLISAAPSGSALLHHPPSIKELSKWPMITFPATLSPNFSDNAPGLFHRRGQRINVKLQVNDLQTALSLVASNMGLTLVPAKVRRLQLDGVDCIHALEDDNITVPVITLRRKEVPNAAIRLANTTLDELVDNRFTGWYP
jgi:DNA-binding transcriptional LysR family regulator